MGTQLKSIDLVPLLSVVVGGASVPLLAVKTAEARRLRSVGGACTVSTITSRDVRCKGPCKSVLSHDVRCLYGVMSHLEAEREAVFDHTGP